MATTGDVQYARSGELRIAYTTFGDPASDVELVVVPGFISNLDLLFELPPSEGLYRRLAKFSRCTVFDKRGTGLSDRSLGFGSLEERADDIRAVMDAAGIQRASLFGFSEGGPLSLLFAASHPDRVVSLAIYASMARVIAAPDYPAGIPDGSQQALLDWTEQNWGTGMALAPFVQHAPENDAVLRLVARYERGACTPSMAAHILDCNMNIDIRSLLPTISTPTLVMHNTRDPLIPVAAGRYLAEHLPNAQYIERDEDFHIDWESSRLWFVDEIEAFLTGHRPPEIEPDRYLATVVFTDIVDSTAHANRLGDRAWRDLLDRHDAVAAEQVTRFGGQLVKNTGDGVLITSDSPSKGIAMAAALRNSLEPLDLPIRAGIHTGEVERRGDDIGGLAVHIGARVVALAEPGEIWVSRTVRDLTSGSSLRFADRGRHELKGVPEAWDLYALVD